MAPGKVPLRSASFIHATVQAKDLIVSFAIDKLDDPEDHESLTLIRTPPYEEWVPPDERGVAFRWGSNDDRRLAEVRWSEERVELADRGGWRMEIDLHRLVRVQVERAMAVVERMNFDGAFRISGEAAPAAAHQEILLDLLESEDPDVVRTALAEAQNARELLSERLLEMLETLTPAWADNSNLASLSLYLLAAWRETRAFEPLVRYFEEGGDEANEVLGDVVVQDLPAILGSIAGGRFELIHRLIENEAVNEWVRVTSISALIGIAVRGELPVDEVEAYLEGLTTRLAPTAVSLWSELAAATADLGSERLLPHIERAHADELIDETVVTMREVRRDVRRGRSRALADPRTLRNSRLIDDVVEATSWWDFFDEPLNSLAGPEDEQVLSAYEDMHDDDLPRPFYVHEPVAQIVRTTSKVGRNDPCPCGSGKKYKKCCGG
ncbi:MAG TPA: DUF1186 domain-containing protein [Thermoanaerobaculia bacterium]|nr:DUF1186 domain-containing protein [Thermoanaerobaculia bacterium]